VSLTFCGDDVVRMGSRVRVRDEDGEEEFAVVPHVEADAIADRISAESPLGRALLGRHVDERSGFGHRAGSWA
jgi:transcription elongation factor GreA